MAAINSGDERFLQVHNIGSRLKRRKATHAIFGIYFTKSDNFESNALLLFG